MKSKWVFLCVVLFCVVTACSDKESQSPPEEAYRSFLSACETGDLSDIEFFLTDKAIQATKIGWLPCETYLLHGVSSNEFEWVEPDAIEYREWDTDQLEDETGADSGYDGVLQVADLKWFVDGKLEPLGESAPSENTTYISTIQVMMIKINGEWKLDCGWC